MSAHLWRKAGISLLALGCLMGGRAVSVSAGPLAQDRVPLQYGQTATGVIDDGQIFHQYSFVGAEGDAVIITMDALSGNLDPLLLLGDENLNLIAEDDDGGSGFNARLEIILPADGTYVIEATRYGQDAEAAGGSGEYRLTLTANQVGGSGGVRRGGLLSALDFGDTERGALDAEDRFHLFWFQAQAGDRVTVQSVPGVGVSAALFLYDDAFIELARDMSGREVSVDIAAGGIYFAALALTDPAAGTYAVTLTGSAGASVAGAASPLAMVYNQRVEGVITDAEPGGQYTFQGTANDQVLIRMEALDGSLDPFLYLYGPNGEIVGQDDDSGGGFDAELTAVLPLEGEYTIVATRFGRDGGSSIGSYALTLNQGATPSVQVNLPSALSPGEGASESGVAEGVALPEQFAGLPQASYGDSLGGTINDERYFQIFVFQANAGDEIVITMEQVSGDLDPFVQLLNADVESVAQNDDISTVNTNSRLEFAIPMDGYYAIFATRYQGEEGSTAGDYVLTLNVTSAPGGGNVSELLATAPLDPNDSAEGQIAETIAALYSFYANRGDRAELTLTAGDPLGSEAVLILADADLNEVAVSFEDSLEHLVTQDGRYVLVVSRQGGPLGEARGFFDIELAGAYGIAPGSGPDATLDSPPGGPVSYGDVIVGEITNALPQIEYTFEGQSGDRIGVRMDALEATLDPLVIVLDPEGNEIVRDDDSGGNLNVLIESYLLTATGQYTILATRFEGAQGASRGRYELALTGIPVSQPAGLGDGALALSLGQTVSGAISDDSSATFYVFQARAGTRIEVTMTTTTGDLDPFLALLDASQALIAQDDDSGGSLNARLVYTIPADGQYYLVATRYQFLEGNTAGEYLLSLAER